MPWDPPWSKADERGLARYVVPDAIQLLALPKNRTDITAAADRRRGRMELVQLIYETLVARTIHYALETYLDKQEVQPIRTPAEVLEAPREGTCLDLTALFCGLCLGYDMVPVLVRVQGHAFAMVSLEHDRREATNRRLRTELGDFPRGMLVDADVLISLIDDERYVAVECTGFAQSECMPPSMPEGQGRIRGVLPFARARGAGREQLDVSERPLHYALDIATLQETWGFAPFSLFQGKVSQGGVNITNNASNQGAQGTFYGPVTFGTTIRGDVVGGDKVIGDKVMGDKVGGDKITVGNISNSAGIAVGRNSQATVNPLDTTTVGGANSQGDLSDALTATRRRVLQRRLAVLTEEYEAASQQIDAELSSVDRIRLRRLLNSLEQEMQQVENDLRHLDA